MAVQTTDYLIHERSGFAGKATVGDLLALLKTFVSADLSSTANRNHRFNNDLRIYGVGKKTTETTNGSDIVYVGTDFDRFFLYAKIGAVITSIYGNDLGLRFDSSNGRYMFRTPPVLDSNLSTNQILSRDSATEEMRIVDNKRFEILSGTGDPNVNNVTAWYVNQLYIDVTDPNNPKYHRADIKATNPDTSYTGSSWRVLAIGLKQKMVLSMACSDEVTDLVVATNVITFRMPYSMTLTEVRASVTEEPTGGDIKVDVLNAGSTILSSKVQIDDNTKSSKVSSSPPSISSTTLIDDAEITINIDQIGATTTGKGLKVYLIGQLI